MKNFEANNFGRIHIPASRVKIVGTKEVVGEVLKLNRLATQIASEEKREKAKRDNLPRRKF